MVKSVLCSSKRSQFDVNLGTVKEKKKQPKETNKTAQDLKSNREAIKKTEAEGILEMNFF